MSESSQAGVAAPGAQPPMTAGKTGDAGPPPPGWGERWLAASRAAAVAAVGVVPFSSALTSLAVFIMLTCWIASGPAALAALRASLRQPLGRALLAFFALAAIGLLYSSAPWSERLESMWGWRRFGYALLLLGMFAPEVWKRRFIGVFFAVTCGGLLASTLAWMGLIPSKTGHEEGVLFQNHATQGIVFSLAVLCSAFYAARAAGRMHWAMLATAVLFALNVLYVTPGRSGYAALAVAAIASAGMLYGWRRAHVWLPAIVALAGIVLVTSPMLRDRVGQGLDELATARTSPFLTSMGLRTVYYATTLELIRERPVFGHGSGSFGKEYSARVARRYSDWRAAPGADPHNQYLFVAVELGFVGLAVFIAVLIAGFLAARAAGPYGWIGGGALAIWCITSLFSSHFRTFPEGHLIGLFVGAMLASPPRAQAARGG